MNNRNKHRADLPMMSHKNIMVCQITQQCANYHPIEVSLEPLSILVASHRHYDVQRLVHQKYIKQAPSAQVTHMMKQDYVCIPHIFHPQVVLELAEDHHKQWMSIYH